MKMQFIKLITPILLLLGCGVKTIPTSAPSQNNTGKPEGITILSYNIHHANPPSKPGIIDLPAIANVLLQQHADIVALQEVDVHTKRSGASMHEAEELARLTGLHSYFARAIDYDGGEYGIAILSKYEMEGLRNIPLPTDDATKVEHRTLALATMVLPGNKKFVFACTHLDAQRDDKNRQLQIRKIVEVLRQESLPVVIAGDFNALPESDVIRQLDQWFTRSCLTDCPYTIPETNPNRTIDYIAFSPAKRFTVLSHDVVDEPYASDHRPVKAVLHFH